METNEKMAVMPVKKLMLSTGIPMIVSMVLQAVYNIVDSAFVSNMANGGEQALNALTLAFPMQVLMVAVGIGTGVGANVLTAKSLGSGDHEQANRTAGNAAFMSAVIYAAFLLFGIFGTGLYIGSQTSDPDAARMGTEYLQICCIFSFGMCFFAIYEKLLQATGHSVYSTAAQIAGAVTNIVLDPIMIYGLLGCPEMGVKCAAYATVIGQIVSFALAFIFHLKVNKSISNKLIYFKPDLRTIKLIYSIGLPAIISQALISVMTYGMNLVLGGIAGEAVTAYGLYYKVMQFLLFAAFGMRDAIMPITAFSYGMGDADRIRDAVKYGHLYTFIIMIAGTIFLEIFAEPFAAVFGLSGVTNDLCISAMRIISVCFVFAGANIAFQGIFQALGAGISSLIISLCRQLVFVFPFALIFAALSGGEAENAWLVWITFPIAEILTSAAAVFLHIRIMRTRVSPSALSAANTVRES
ncbi:MAG: MATE family efflux transporter [Ruminiclostridium sp.]|nr:MATE family efflux transporter [Ruminiclostridium sp.]